MVVLVVVVVVVVDVRNSGTEEMVEKPCAQERARDRGEEVREPGLYNDAFVYHKLGYVHRTLEMR